MTSILGSYDINPILVKERNKSTFDIQKLTYFFEGSQEKTKKRKELEKNFFECEFPAHLFKVPIDYLNHNEVYEEALIKANYLYNQATFLDNPGDLLAIAEALHYEASPLLLHFSMFIPALMSHCNSEQQAFWLPQAFELKVIGTYAQTELGHGSYLKGLQTRADYDQKSQTFVLNTPNLESIKWWPGGLGRTANFAIILAQLYINNVHHGLHLFIVQLRDLETHKPLKGITIGELGPKMGMRAADNGYLHLKNVVIPRAQMLMKNARIDKEGNYYASVNKEKLNRGTMLLVRVLLIEMISTNVSKAVTIAVRYSAVRRQGLNPDKSAEAEELQVIDYQAQKYKLIPCICIAHASKAVSIFLLSAFKETNEILENFNELGQTPLLHALSVGIKALVSEIGSSSVEICRKACGGQGFMLISGLPRIYANTVAVCTYEGENTLLYLQTAQYLYKISSTFPTNVKFRNETLSCIDYVLSLKNFKTVSNLLNKPISISTLIHLQACSASYFIYKAFERLHLEEKTKAQSFEQAWICSQVHLIKAAKSFLTYYLVSKYFDWIKKAESIDLKIYQILEKLCFFYNLYLIVENSGDFLLLGLEVKHLNLLTNKMLSLMNMIRPDMVALVDAFDFHDMILMSAIGCYDGALYERLFDLVKRFPQNDNTAISIFQKYIKEMTQNKL